MNRAKLIPLSLRLFNSCSATRHSGYHLLRLNQVTHFSYLTQSQHIPKPHFNRISSNSHKSLYFSSNPESFIQIVLSNDYWSDEIENELEKLNPNVTHESVVHILVKLSKNPQKSLDFFRWACDKKGFNPTYLPYTLLLRNLACKEFLKEFWAVASEIKEKGYNFDPQFSATIRDNLKLQNLDNTVEEWIKFHKTLNLGDGGNDVGDKIVEVILGSDWNEEVGSKLEKLEFPLTDDFLFGVIRKLREEPSKALKFFEWVAKCRNYDHNSVTYSGMARVLARRGLMREFWDLVTRMRSEGYEIDSYPKISRSLRNEDGVKLFEFMMDGPYKLSEQECIWILKDLAHDSDPDIDLINRVINKYVEAGNSLTKAIYDNIHRSLCKVGRFEEAKNIVKDMRNAGCEPDNITYSQEVFGLCNRGRFEDAFLVLNRMEDEGCVPDIKTWTILIQAHCAAGHLDQALTCFAQMLEKSIEPDADLFSVLLNGFLSQNLLLGAYKFLVKMVNTASLKPWQATYKVMIDKLVEGKKLEEASNLLRMMRQHNYPPYAKPIVEHIAKSGTLEDAKKLLGALSMVGHAPSNAAYVNIITSFFEEGRYTEAKNLLYASPHRVRNQKKIKKLFGGYVQEQQDS